MAIVAAATLCALDAPAIAEPGILEQGRTASGEPNYLTSPYHGVLDGNGRTIPCRCRYGGRTYRVGEVVCMATHVGTVLTRCDLLENTTSWMPTATPCEVSNLGSGGGHMELVSAVARRVDSP